MKITPLNIARDLAQGPFYKDKKMMGKDTSG